MDNAVILHMGRHKTGSSALQRYLDAVRDQLAAHGVVFSAVGTKRNGRANNLLARACMDRHAAADEAQAGTFRADLAAEFAALQPGQRLLVTSENFQNANPRRVAGLLPFPLHLVVYLREQFEYLLSAYSQAVHAQRVSVDVETFEGRGFAPDYAVFLDRWQGEFPDARWSVGIYDRDLLTGGDIRRDFMAVLELPFVEDAGLSRLAERNLSLGGAVLEFKRRLNALPFDAVIGERFLYRELQRVARARPELNRGVNFPPGLAARVREKYRASNAAVARRWFGAGEAAFRLRDIEPVDPALLEWPALEAVARGLDEVREGLGERLLALLRGHGAPGK